MTFTRVLQNTQENTLFRDACIVLLSSFLIALAGQFSIPLPFTPVPISFRFQTILFLSVLLGSRRASLATLLFLGQGALGLFPMSGSYGIAGLMGPNGGYYFGFVIAAFVVGKICEGNKSFSFARTSLAMLAGTFIVYVCGVAYLSTFVGFPKAILLGLAPFVLGDLLKTAICVKILQRLKRSV